MAENIYIYEVYNVCYILKSDQVSVSFIRECVLIDKDKIKSFPVQFILLKQC